jgi:hypothetical protein
MGLLLAPLPGLGVAPAMAAGHGGGHEQRPAAAGEQRGARGRAAWQRGHDAGGDPGVSGRLRRHPTTAARACVKTPARIDLPLARGSEFSIVLIAVARVL